MYKKYGATANGANGANGLSRDMDLARKAYLVHDPGASILAHSNGGKKKADEGHREAGDFIKSIVYGGLDGVLTAFAIVSGAAGGNLDPEVVLILGISNIIADAFSMGVGDTVSTLAYHEHVAQERRRECWEFDNHPEGELQEMIELYESRGLPRSSAETVVRTMSKYKEFFIDIMMLEELQLKVPGPEEDPYKDGFVTFLSFFVFGSMPLLGYIIVPLAFPDASSNVLFSSACVMTMLVLFVLGSFKSRFSASKWYWSGLEFFLLGSAAAAVSYFIGALVKEIAEDLLHTDAPLP